MKTQLSILIPMLLVYPPALPAADEAKPRSWTGTVRGEVLKIDGEAFLVEDSLGRNIQLHVGPNGSRDDNIQVGDKIAARIVHNGNETYIKSLKKLASSSSTGSSSLIEGQILDMARGFYLIKEPGGKEVRLRVDAKTWKDGNITVGDSILATIDDFQTVHAESLTKH